jgi:hypothetical protein
VRHWRDQHLLERRGREPITPEHVRLGEDHAVRVGVKAVELLIREAS